MSLRAAVAVALTLLSLTAFAEAAKKPKPQAAPEGAPAAEAAAPAPSGDPVVATVNGAAIHRSDIQEAARELPPQARQLPPDKLYMQLLDRMIATTLVAQAAHKAKLQDTAEVKRRLAWVENQVLAQAYIDRMVQGGINDEKMKALYDKAIKDAPQREEVNARHILLGSEADAKAVIEELKKGADFVTLAKEKTTDPAGKTSGGDLGWFPKDQMVPEFANAAFALKKGEITTIPVQTKYGWHVIKLEDRRVAPPPTFEQMKPQLGEELARQMVAEKMEELKKTAHVDVFNGDGSRPGATKPAAPKPAPAPAPQAAPPDGEAPPTLSPATKPQ